MGGDPGLTLALEPADSAASRALQRAFIADIASRYPGWDPGKSQSAAASDLGPPGGAWVVAYLDGRPVGCGGLKALGAETAEIRRVYLDPSARGRGIGRNLLQELELHARRLGYRRVRLTTGDRQPEALGLFQTAGYAEVTAFNDNLFTHHWMEKTL